MEQIRKPFQGVFNIIRFNWHFYVISLVLTFLLILLNSYLDEIYHIYLSLFIFLSLGSMVISLLTSYYIYDLSNLYKLSWFEFNFESNPKIVNINAGFDETSELLKNKFKNPELTVLDFYDPLKHTEISIKRARKAYPAFSGTQEVTTSVLPLKNNYADTIFVILSAHEIRNEDERILFFNELNRALKPSGRIIVTEHLRDLPNFMAYNIGFFHFHSKATWLKTFQNAKFIIDKEIKITPFISTFILKKDGTSN